MKKTILILATLTIFFGCDKEENANPAKACFEFHPDASTNPLENNYIGDEITFTNCSEDATTYLWDFGNGDTALDAEPKYTFIEAKGYLVSLQVNDNANQKISKIINVYEFPSHFSVNNASYNLQRSIGEYYGRTNVGSYVHGLTFISENFVTIEENGIIIGLLGSGEYISFEMYSSSSSKISDGTYSLTSDGAPGTFYSAICYIHANFETSTAEYAHEINNGSITIKNVGELIMAEINCTTTEGYTLTGSFRAKLEKHDNSNLTRKSNTRSIKRN